MRSSRCSSTSPTCKRAARDRSLAERSPPWLHEEERNLREGRVGLEYIERVLALRAELRAELAGLVGAEADQVALTASTTDGCNVVLAGLDLAPEDEVVTTTDEHFGLIGPLHASGARVVVVPPDADAIAAAVTPRTRLLAVSHVLWTTGQVLPVRELRERTGIPILVDGAQSVGAIPVDAARTRLPHDLRAEVALWTRVDRSAGRRRSRTTSCRPSELLLAAGVRP